jgi:hypothetical protein
MPRSSDSGPFKCQLRPQLFGGIQLPGADLWSRTADEGTAPVRRIAVAQRRARRQETTEQPAARRRWGLSRVLEARWPSPLVPVCSCEAGGDHPHCGTVKSMCERVPHTVS